MENRYKIILSGNQIYKEAELPADMERVTVGTGIDCTVRLRRDLFFESIQIEFVKESGGWRATCSDNIYFTEGDIRKYMTRKVIHGDTLEVRYQESEGLVFRIDFQIDFDSGSHRCERMINLDKYQTISIGNNSAYEIALSGVYARREFVRLMRGHGGWTLEVMNSEYGVYHNGKKTEQKEWIKDGDFFSVADYYFFLKGNALWAEIRSDLTVNGLGFGDYPERNGYPRFSRNTRLKTVICEDKIEILDPPSKPQKPKSNLFMKLFPSFGMLIAAGAMAFMGGTMIIFSLISCTIAIITAVVGVMEGKKEFREKTANRIEVYQKYIASKRQEIEECRNREWTERNEIYIPAEQEIQQVETFSPDLFDRTPQDEDFLCVRLGSGPIESARQVNYKKQEKLEIEDDLSLLPEQTASFYKELQNAPVICDLKNVNAVGITGEEADRFELLKLIVTDVALRHFAADVKLFFVAEKEHAGRMHLFRFLPGAYCAQTDTRGIVTDDESKTLIFEYLYKELTMRAQEKRLYPHLLVFFYDEYGYKKHPISQFTEKGKDLGVTFLFFGQTRADIPVGCDYVVQLSGGYRGVLINAAEKSKTVPFVSSQISDTLAVRIVRTLAPVCTDEVSLEGELIKNISMFKMLNILSVEDLDLKARWSASKVTKSMAAPVGVSKTGIVMLDLHDKAHGPHGLVAGTTGSGKSEILQTYILSMATLYHPYEAAFVIIDFKGGGMVNQFAQLPHLLGAITNIDGNAINRSLKSIKAELQKRQKYFAQADVNHIDKYIRKYKAGEVSEPLPHLIIIVDEFAELKAEQPEFMKELISAARIGRSLGVHLILATQKPAGQVNEQIWSNSRFKLCLKVQSKEDSNEVLKSPLAAEIKEPGRAYLQVGNNEIFELFQSAYSGVPEREDEGTGKAFTIYEVPDGGKKVPVYVKKKNKGQEGMNNQLEAIVSYVSEYFRSIQIPQLPDICLPPLRECIEFPPVSKEAVQEQKKEVGFYAWIGVYDDPDHQNQDQYAVNLSAANMIIIGSAQTGKTTILQNVIRSLSEQYTPDEVAIYIIDFASMVLKNFETLNHVGGVVSSSEDEKLKNLFKMLWEEMETRKEKLLSVGVSSFVAYKEAGRTDMKQIVLIIDNLTALKELYFQDDDELLNLCREGITVGISIVIANAQTAGIGYKYLSSFSN
ncbi:MAG: type VII secretion protein EssC, partial [[Ruminococcus] torques]